MSTKVAVAVLWFVNQIFGSISKYDILGGK